MKNSGKILLIICEILLGILLFINPEGFTTVVIRTAGVIMLIAAVCSAIVYFRLDPIEAHLEQCLAKALILLVVGLFCVIKTDWLINTFPFFIVIGAVILLTGILRIQWTVDMFRMKIEPWRCWVSGGCAVLTVVLACIIIFNPKVVWAFIAISLLVSAACDIAIMIFIHALEKEVEKELGEIEYREE